MINQKVTAFLAFWFLAYCIKDSLQIKGGGRSGDLISRSIGQSLLETQAQWGKPYTLMNFYDSTSLSFSAAPDNFDFKLGTCLTLMFNGQEVSYKTAGQNAFKQLTQIPDGIKLSSIEIERFNKFLVIIKGSSADECEEKEFEIPLPTGDCDESDAHVNKLTTTGSFENLAIRRSGATKSDGLLIMKANLAWATPAQQKSTLAGGEAYKSVDDSDFTTFKNNSCSSTLNNSPNQWWRTDLMKEVQVKEVRILTRSDCCESWLDNFFITIGNSIEDLWKGESSHARCGAIQTGVVNDGKEIVIKCDVNNKQIRGRYLTIQRTDDKALSFCDVRVIGC